jgi:thiamine biosynthesis lipoprotein
VAKLRLALDAMRTRFECVLHGEDGVRLRAAGEEALREIRATDEELSFFRNDSALARMNRAAAAGWIGVPERMFRLLQSCKDLHAESGGAFDPGFRTAPAAGFTAVELNKTHRAVRYADPRLALDFGAIGKGEALDRAAAVLREHGVESALLHGGTSSVLALGEPLGARGWQIGIGERACVLLRDAALGVSGNARLHIRDPRSVAAAGGATRLAAVVAISAAVADAASTALLIVGRDEFEFRRYPEEPLIAP